MQTISPREYATKHGYRSVSTIYKMMREGRLPFVIETMEVMRIPVDAEYNPVKAT